MFQFFTMAFFVSHTMCCTLAVLFDAQLLPHRWHSFHELQTLSALLVELHDVSFFT